VKKASVKVFITSTNKFRAKITEPGVPAYEVTIGGRAWKRGKGRAHIDVILIKIQKIVEALLDEYGACIAEKNTMFFYKWLIMLQNNVNSLRAITSCLINSKGVK